MFANWYSKSFSHSAVLQFMQDENGTSIFHHFYRSLLINLIVVETKKLIFKYFQTGCPKKQNAAGATVQRLNHQLQLLIFVTGATTGGGVLFSSRCRFFLPILANSSFFVANSRIFCCNFIGTNISYDHWSDRVLICRCPSSCRWLRCVSQAASTSLLPSLSSATPLFVIPSLR